MAKYAIQTRRGSEWHDWIAIAERSAAEQAWETFAATGKTAARLIERNGRTRILATKRRVWGPKDQRSNAV